MYVVVLLATEAQYVRTKSYAAPIPAGTEALVYKKKTLSDACTRLLF